MSDSMAFQPSAPAVRTSGIVAFLRGVLERVVAAQGKTVDGLPPMMFRFPPL